jgi:hypothetical protein
MDPDNLVLQDSSDRNSVLCAGTSGTIDSKEEDVEGAKKSKGRKKDRKKAQKEDRARPSRVRFEVEYATADVYQKREEKRRKDEEQQKSGGWLSSMAKGFGLGQNMVQDAEREPGWESLSVDAVPNREERLAQEKWKRKQEKNRRKKEKRLAKEKARVARRTKKQEESNQSNRAGAETKHQDPISENVQESQDSPSKPNVGDGGEDHSQCAKTKVSETEIAHENMPVVYRSLMFDDYDFEDDFRNGSCTIVGLETGCRYAARVRVILPPSSDQNSENGIPGQWSHYVIFNTLSS